MSVASPARTAGADATLTVAGVARSARAAFDRIAEVDVLDLAPRLTLVLLILYSGDYWYLRVPMTVVCALALLYRAVYRSPDFWLVITAIMASGNYLNWYVIDNHKYLMTYWCFALFLSLLSRNPRASLAFNSRALIALSFSFATLWKLISGSYLDNRFFEFTLLVDDRFRDVAQSLGGIAPATYFENTERFLWFHRFDSTIDTVTLESSAALEGLSQTLTWWTLGIEGLIAIAFWLPAGWAIARWRHWLLIFFGLTTYSIANVVGFGWLLMVLGVAQTERSQPYVRAAYLATFLIIQVYLIPWWRVLDAVIALFGGSSGGSG